MLFTIVDLTHCYHLCVIDCTSTQINNLLSVLAQTENSERSPTARGLLFVLYWPQQLIIFNCPTQYTKKNPAIRGSFFIRLMCGGNTLFVFLRRGALDGLSWPHRTYSIDRSFCIATSSAGVYSITLPPGYKFINA